MFTILILAYVCQLGSQPEGCATLGSNVAQPSGCEPLFNAPTTATWYYAHW